jgi:hypothetical protein
MVCSRGPGSLTRVGTVRPGIGRPVGARTPTGTTLWPALPTLAARLAGRQRRAMRVVGPFAFGWFCLTGRRC